MKLREAAEWGNYKDGDNSDVPEYDDLMSEKDPEELLKNRLDIFMRRLDTVTIKFMPRPTVNPLAIESNVTQFRMLQVSDETLNQPPRVPRLGNAIPKKLSPALIQRNNQGTIIIEKTTSETFRMTPLIQNDEAAAPWPNVPTDNLFDLVEDPPHLASIASMPKNIPSSKVLDSIYDVLPREAQKITDEVWPANHVERNPNMTLREQAEYFYSMNNATMDENGSNRVGCKIGVGDELEKALARLKHLWCPPQDNTNNCFFLCIQEAMKNDHFASQVGQKYIQQAILDNMGKDDNGFTDFTIAQHIADVTGDIYHIHQIVRVREDKKTFVQSM